MSNPQWSAPVIDCDGHLVESIPEMAEYLDPIARKMATNPGRNRSGVFPGLDGIHYPREAEIPDEQKAKARPYVTASDYRKGSGEDIVAFQEKAGLEASVLFASEALSVSFVQQTDYAVRVCRGYNDYVADRYRGGQRHALPAGHHPHAERERGRAGTAPRGAGPRPAGRHAAIARLSAALRTRLLLAGVRGGVQPRRRHGHPWRFQHRLRHRHLH